MPSRSTKSSAFHVLTGAALGGVVTHALMDTLPATVLTPWESALSSPYVAIGMTVGALMGMKKKPSKRGAQSNSDAATTSACASDQRQAANDCQFNKKPHASSISSMFGLALPAIVRAHPQKFE